MLVEIAGLASVAAASTGVDLTTRLGELLAAGPHIVLAILLILAELLAAGPHTVLAILLILAEPVGGENGSNGTRVFS